MGIVADPRSRVPAVAGTQGEQYPLWLSIALHLFPGAVLTAFIIVVASALPWSPSWPC